MPALFRVPGSVCVSVVAPAARALFAKTRALQQSPFVGELKLYFDF